MTSDSSLPPTLDASNEPAHPPSPIPAPSSRRGVDAVGGRRRGLGSASLLLGVAALVAVGGIAFAAGRVTAPVAASTFNGRAAFGNPGAGRSQASGAPGFRSGLGAIDLRGTVTAVNGDMLTLDLGSGRTIQVKTDASTTYQHATAGSAADVTSGSKVIVQLKAGQGGLAFGGQSGQTGSVSAQEITVAGE